MTVPTALIPNIEEAQDGEGGSDPVADFMEEHASTSVADGRNWAKDASVVSYIHANLTSMLPQIRNDMLAMHEEWRSVARMVALMHDTGQRYKGRSNAYIPAYARAKKTLVASLSQGIFPTDEVAGVTSRERPNDPEPADALAVKSYLQWELEKNARIRRQMKPFLGNLVDYGFTVAKYWYEKAPKTKRTMKLGPVGPVSSTKDDTQREGLRFSTRSVFDFYVFPYNIGELEEASLIFEDIPVPRSYILERKRAGDWENCDQMLEAPEIPEATTNAQEAQNENMKSVSNQRQFGDSDIGDILTVTEVWVDLVLPAAAYMADEEKGTPVPCKVVMAGDIIALVCRNPFWHQQAPYLCERDDKKVGSFYGKGVGFLVKSLQYLLNDFSNQMNDNGTMGLNPMTLVNPSTLAGPLTPIKPGGVWLTTDVQNGIKFDRPPIEQIQYGMALITLYSGMLADYTGATPSLQGQSQGKGGKTATGMQLLQKNAMNPLKDMVEDLEESVMSPLMYGCWKLGQQYRPLAFMMEVMGDTGGWNPKSMNKSALRGDFIFRWLASSQAANAQQRAAQAMQLLSTLTPPLVQLLAQNGHQVDPYPLMERIYKDVMGFRDFSKFVKPLQQQMLGPDGQPMGPGAPGQPPGPGGDPRSAALQNPNGAESEASTMAPGEGDEFAVLRQQVEAATAEQGQEPGDDQ